MTITIQRTQGRTVSVSGDRRVQQTTVGATDSAFGVNVGRAVSGAGRSLSQTGNQIANEALRIQNENNRRKAKELDVQREEAYRNFLYGDGTEENPGHYSKRGGNAVDSAKDAEEALRKINRDILAGQKNPAVQQMFNDSASARLNSELNSLARFTGKERRVAADTVSEARLLEATQTFAADPSNNQNLAQSLAITRSEVLELSERNGWDPEVTQSKLEEAQTALFKEGIVSALKQNDPTLARELFNDFKGRMDAPVANQVEAMLKEGETTTLSQAAADEIMSEPGATDAELLAEARKISNPQVRDQTVRRVKTRIAERKAEKQAAVKDLTSDAFGTIFEGGSFDQWKTQNPEEFQVLARENPKALAEIQKAEEFRNNDQRFSDTSDGETFDRLYDLSPAELASTDLREERHNLTEKEFNTLRTLRRAARTASGAGGDKKVKAAFTRGDQILKSLAPASLKWDLGGESKKNHEDRIRMQSAMKVWIQDFVDEEGRVPSELEQREQALELFSQRKGGLFGRKFKFFGEELDQLRSSISDEQRANLTIAKADIDPAMMEEMNALLNRADVQESLRRNNIQVNDDLLEQLAGAWSVQDGTRINKLLGG